MNDNINKDTLHTEAKSIALAAIAEELEYSSDGQHGRALMHEACDNHSWVIYDHKAQQLCLNCCTEWGEDYLEKRGCRWGSLREHTCAVAFATLLEAATACYNTLKEDIDAAQESNR